MSKLQALIKKREALDKEIAKVQAEQKRAGKIAELAAETGLLDLTDEELLAAFKQITARKKSAAGHGEASE